MRLAEDLRDRTRHLKRNDQIDPLDLIEWLEDQGYEVVCASSGSEALRCAARLFST